MEPTTSSLDMIIELFQRIERTEHENRRLHAELNELKTQHIRQNEDTWKSVFKSMECLECKSCIEHLKELAVKAGVFKK